ncbi:Phage portal protein, lambda family [Sulfitobacter guttiformis KCTC 32187]|nr:Phage portal protein, lambda family [Sulfitobacter guttiformis KCTC 32187]
MIESVPAALSFIRRVSCDLVDNNPHARRAVQVLVSHHIGTGIRVSVKGDSEFEAFLNNWFSSTSSDYEGRLNFYGTQAVASRGMFRAGDSFIIYRVEYKDDKLHLTTQLIDASQLEDMATPKYKNNEVHSGVEVDQSGRIVGYHIKETLDAVSSPWGVNQSRFVPVEDVAHMMEIQHGGELRGMPRGATSFLVNQDRSELMFAAVQKAKGEANFQGVITSAIGSDDDDFNLGDGGGDDQPFGSNAVENDDGSWSLQMIEEVAPGTFPELPPGKQLVPFSINSVAGFTDYMRISMQSCAVAYGVTYSQISGDTNGQKFGTTKSDASEFNRGVDCTRAHTIYPWIMRTVERLKKIYEINTGKSVTSTITLVAPAREVLEPEKEISVVIKKLQSGLLSWSQACLAEGKDPEEQLAEIKEERKRARDAEVNLMFGDFSFEELEKLLEEEAPEPWGGGP